jgi:hypothetical protein
MIRSNPHICEISKGTVGTMLNMFFDETTGGNKGQQLLKEAEVLSIKERLGYNSSCQAEKLIIDQVLLCWAGVNFAENMAMIFLNKEGTSVSTFNFYQDNLSRYQNRYLRAIETLARVRKLSKGIAFQVNIATDGGQQVNVNEVKEGK